MEGDILAEINNICVRKMCHSDVVQVLKDCTRNKAATITVERINFSKNKIRKKDDLKLGIYRTKTPTENCPLLMEAQNNQLDCSNGLKRSAEIFGLDYNMQPCYSRSQSPGNELDQNESWNRKRSPDMYKHADNNYMSMVSRSNNNYYAGGNDYMSRSSEVNDNYFYSLANNQRKESTSFEHEQPLPTNGDARYDFVFFFFLNEFFCLLGYFVDRIGEIYR